MGDTEGTDKGLSDWGVVGWGVLIGLAVIALLAAAYAIGATKGEADARKELAGATAVAPAETAAPSGEEPVPPAEDVALFQATCGGCHTLAAAGTTGTVGPNLDDLAPTKEQVLAAIANGGVGTGQMPAGLLSGQDAERVAAVVSSASAGAS